MGKELHNELQGQLLSSLPPLYRRVRERSANAVAGRANAIAEKLPVGQKPSLARLLHESLQQLHAEASGLDGELNELNRAYAAAPDAKSRRAVLQAYLRRTVTDSSALKADLGALDRWLSVDTLRERIERRRQLLGVQEETALRCLAGHLRQAEEIALSALDAAALATATLLLALKGARPQTQQAALEVLIALSGRLTGVLPSLPQAASALISIVDQRDGNPFVQAEALRALFRTDATHANALLDRRLSPPYPSERDFLFRRQVVEVVVPELDAGRREEVLSQLVAEDPSEWVRIGICEVLRPTPAELKLLRTLAGFDEKSAKVRAAAVLACARMAADAAECWDVLSESIAADADAVVQRLACEQAAERIATLPQTAREKLRWSLMSLRLRDGVSGAVLEAATIAEQALLRTTDPVRAKWTERLARFVAQIPLGEKRKLDLTAEAGMPSLPEDGALLGAILSELSTFDYGLSATRQDAVLTIWRGERFRRRAWRIFHELKRPAPNKRQGFTHTIGREMRGELRAHPWRLDEITETTVPGERVHVASQGCWGRHLPLVDDLLDLPMSGDGVVRLFSGHGVTTIQAPQSKAARMKMKWRLTAQYERWARLRLSSLDGTEPRERARFAEAVESELGVQLTFAPYGGAAEKVPQMIGTLFVHSRHASNDPKPPSAPSDGEAPRVTTGEGANAPVAMMALAAAPTVTWTGHALEKLSDVDQYLVSTNGNGMVALAVFTAALFSWFLVRAYKSREGIRQARAKVPLSVGGWGTRGKSGTERLKAALFGGLGFEVFAKTTGSEAMFVHSAPGAAPSEFFIFRPYDKATIWEQRDMVELSKRLDTEVFLWECMALQPNFVELLQNDWMRDDISTLTNAYPDHEDIQGPAGINVAEVITKFMPEGGKVVTSEDNFLPLFEEQAKRKGTELVHAPWWQAELIPDELLALFPYREHPRNVALVATMAEQLGVQRSQAIAMMAEHVQPEIGVLKVFPTAKVRGRALSFINGHSANERTGFLNNWRRTGLDQLDPNGTPDRAVITVVNNRWDRVARSEVFSRILVEDAPADKHVLIGTNLEGLQKYVRSALDAFLSRTEVVTAEDVSTDAGRDRATERLTRLMARVKVPRATTDGFLDRVSRYASAAGLALEITPALVTAVGAALEGKRDTVSVEKTRSALRGTLELLEAALVASDAPVAPHPELVETLSSATRDEVLDHAIYLLARMAVHATLEARLTTLSAAEVSSFNEEARAAYRELFLETLVPVHDAQATGDQIVDVCARSVPPGVHVSMMGAQNIKGTGLDWVYRWIALDRVETALKGLSSDRPDVRKRAYDSIATFEDHGFVDAGVARAGLPPLIARAATKEEADRLRMLLMRVDRLHTTKVAGLTASTRVTSAGAKVVEKLEKWFDYLDSIRRRRLNEQLIEDLVHFRVSHPRAALETRKLYERQKGGWLVPMFAGMFRRKKLEETSADVTFVQVPDEKIAVADKVEVVVPRNEATKGNEDLRE